MFITHINGFKATNTPIKGVYHFIYATNNAEAKAEAESCIKNVQAVGLPKTTTIWCDFEYDTVTKAKAKGITLGPNECRSFTKTFCNTIKAAGYPTGIYTNQDYAKNWYGENFLKEYTVWYAWYNQNKPSYSCKVWQYSSKGRLPGFNENLDMDILYEDDFVVVDNGELDISLGKEPTTTTTITPAESACQWMEALANNSAHGYDQIYRWGEKGDYDCSSAVITAYQQAGIPVKTKGATYTGNMYSTFIKCGFKDVTKQVNLSNGSGMLRGDVLLNTVHHTAMYCGNGKEVEASINELGKATGGKPGDQTGKEILIRSYRNFPWNYVLRYDGGSATPIQKQTTLTLTEIQKGSVGEVVRLLQAILKAMGYNGSDGLPLDLDGDFGANTDYALKAYQNTIGLEADGVAGKQTWTKIKAGLIV